MLKHVPLPSSSKRGQPYFLLPLTMIAFASVEQDRPSQHPPEKLLTTTTLKP